MILRKDENYRQLSEHLRRYGGFENDKKVCYVCGKLIPKRYRVPGWKIQFCSDQCIFAYWGVLNKQIREEFKIDLQK